jgi:hypothetical protein
MLRDFYRYQIEPRPEVVRQLVEAMLVDGAFPLVIFGGMGFPAWKIDMRRAPVPLGSGALFLSVLVGGLVDYLNRTVWVPVALATIG